MVNNDNKIFLSPPHMNGDEQKYIKEAFETNWIAPLGPNVDAFEKEVAEYVDVKAAAAVSSGTAAIHLALRLLDVKAGDKVFCSSLTFVASVNPILYQHAEPILIDSELDTWNMCPKALERAFIAADKERDLPKAVIVVNLYGQSAMMEEIIQICGRYDVPIIEDAAESLGSEYKGKKSGTFGRFGIFSFNGNKIITTSGGGMLVSNDDQAIEKSKFFSTQARDHAFHYQHSEIGYNYRMSNILAGIGRAQLRGIDNRVKQKRNIFQYYINELGGIKGLTFMPEYKDSYHNRWLTTLTIDVEKVGFAPVEMIHALAKENIEARPVWKPLHLQPLFKRYKYYSYHENMSVSEQLFASGVCLPSGTSMTEEDQARVIHTVKTFISR